MRNVFGGLLMAVGMITMTVIWIYTTVLFFGSGQMLLGLISLVVPPADLVLPFLISPMLGIMGIAGTLVAFAGAAIRSD